MRDRFPLLLTLALLGAVTIPEALLAEQPGNGQNAPKQQPGQEGGDKSFVLPDLRLPPVPQYERPPILRFLGWLFGEGRWLLYGLLVLFMGIGGSAAITRRSYEKPGSAPIPGGMKQGSDPGPLYVGLGVAPRLLHLPAGPPDSGGTPPETRELVLTDRLTERELVERLGTPTLTFKPSLANMVAGLILGFLLAGSGATGGVAMLIHGRSLAATFPAPVAGTILLVLVLLGLALSGIALLVWATRTLSLRVLVCPAGIIRVYRGRAVGCCWDQIREVKVVELTVGKDRPDRTCTVRREDGLTFVFTTNRVAHLSRLIKAIGDHVPLTYAF